VAVGDGVEGARVDGYRGFHVYGGRGVV
jgi:hypothetical protein